MAIAIFAVDIYGLNLTSLISDISFFAIIPTCRTLLFLGLFIFYLVIIWGFAYRSYERLYMTGLSRRSYILSNISFSIPVVLPWLLLSGITDIINALPFELPKRFLSTTEGEIIYFSVFLFVVVIIGPSIIQRFWRCKPLEKGYERSRIATLCKRAGLKYADILYWPIFGGKMITAGIMGLIKKFRYILVTSALLEYLESEEIDAVIAHEIGHIKKKHLLFYLLFFAGYTLLSYTFFDFIVYFIIYAEPICKLMSSFGFNQNSVNQDSITSAIFSLVIILMFIVYFRYIFGYFMRNFERQADTYVYTLFGSSKHLVSTFKKIAATSGQSPDKPNWHHFSIKERIAYLNKCEEDRTWIARQDKKIKKSIAIYLACMFLTGIIGYNLNFGESGNRLNKQFLERIILKKLEKKPDSPNFYSALGDLYYSSKRYEETIKAYEQSIIYKPDNPQILNNLAWLYATCDDKRFRNPKRSLKLAIKAVRLKEAPHILDTLAESYYVNGQIEDAISVEISALNLAKKNRSYYESQLEKFMKKSTNKWHPSQ